MRCCFVILFKYAKAVVLLLLASAADHVLEGTLKLGGQEHFYLEPNAAIVLPSENDEYLLISSTQAPNKHQVQLLP